MDNNKKSAEDLEWEKAKKFYITHKQRNVGQTQYTFLDIRFSPHWEALDDL